MSWDPPGSKAPDAGVIIGEDGSETVASIKTSDRGDTIIADGDYSGDGSKNPDGTTQPDDRPEFNQFHDHQWNNPTTGESGYVERGNYTGPGGSSSANPEKTGGEVTGS